ncbi:hypothetical protein ACHWQZ_G001656 [Mnemiopsis leidyi]
MSSYTINGTVSFLSSSGKERTPITIDMIDGGQVDVSPFNGVIPPSLKEGSTVKIRVKPRRIGEVTYLNVIGIKIVEDGPAPTPTPTPTLKKPRKKQGGRGKQLPSSSSASQDIINWDQLFDQNTVNQNDQ